MPKDFAGRSSASTRKRKRKTPRRVSPKQRVLFHGPSFAIGALVGTAIVILAAYGPDLLQNPHQNVATSEPANVESKPTMTFDFPDMLKNSQVNPDPEPYAVPEEIDDPDKVYHVQVASFRNLEDAEQLRARLLLENYPVQTASSDAKGERWYRVVLGPFQRKIDASRAINRLRAQGLAPILHG